MQIRTPSFVGVGVEGAPTLEGEETKKEIRSIPRPDWEKADRFKSRPARFARIV